MTAPVAPMEARCEHCRDTGSLSKWTGGDLDCTHCDAAEKRGALYATVEAARKVAMGEYRLASFDAVWLAYQLGQAAPVAQPTEDTGKIMAWLSADGTEAKTAESKEWMETRDYGVWTEVAKRYVTPLYAAPQPALPKLPSTPEEVVAFIDGQFDSMDTVGNVEDRRITLTVHDLLSCFQNLADFAEEQPAQQVEAVGKAPQKLRDIGELLRTQNNRITDSPIFIVQQKRAYVAAEGHDHDRIEWRESENGDYVEATPLRHSRLEAIFDQTGDEPFGWKRFAMKDRWEFVTACFTEQGCKDYIASNGHNLNEPRIYAEGSYRNEEYRAVRKWLMSLNAAPQLEAQQAGDVALKAARYDWLVENVRSGSIGFDDWWINGDEPASEWNASIDAAIEQGRKA